METLGNKTDFLAALRYPGAELLESKSMIVRPGKKPDFYLTSNGKKYKVPYSIQASAKRFKVVDFVETRPRTAISNEHSVFVLNVYHANLDNWAAGKKFVSRNIEDSLDGVKQVQSYDGKIYEVGNRYHGQTELYEHGEFKCTAVIALLKPIVS